MERVRKEKRNLPGGIRLMTRVGYAMFVHPESLPHTSLQTAGSEHPTVSVKQQAYRHS